MVYFKRHYNDGSTRPSRLRVNDFVDQHIDRKGSRPPEGAFPSCLPPVIASRYASLHDGHAPAVITASSP